MKHAFLIIAHGNWEQLCLLISQIDAKNHDIYIHIDKKCQNIPHNKIMKAALNSRIEIVSEYKVYWGSFELLQTELFLLEKATKRKYDYYHMLSGMDLLIKSNKYFDDFFSKNNGKEFVHFDTDKRLKTDKEIERRTRCYHYFTNYRRRFKHNFFNKFFDFLERSSLVIQLILGVNRTKKYDLDIKYGSQWFSITNKFASYLLNKKEEIYNIFYKTKCSDELFVQTFLYNSEFKENLYNKNYNDDITANMRLLDIKNRGKNGSPYVWTINDFEEIKKSQCLIARKFDINRDAEIVNKVLSMTTRRKNNGEN